MGTGLNLSPLSRGILKAYNEALEKAKHAAVPPPLFFLMDFKQIVCYIAGK
jgi:hypothetical protein